MRHPNSTSLLTYWNSRRGQRPYPLRNEIEPSDIAKLLPHILIGEIISDTERRFRLAGTTLCALTGKELKGTEISDLWLPENRRNASGILRAVSDGLPAALSMDGLSEGGRVLHAEALFLPMGGPEGQCNRILGMISLFEAPYWVGHDPLAGFSTTGFRLIDPEEQNALVASKVNVASLKSTAMFQHQPSHDRRNRSPFLVIEGGRKE